LSIKNSLSLGCVLPEPTVLVSQHPDCSGQLNKCRQLKKMLLQWVARRSRSARNLGVFVWQVMAVNVVVNAVLVIIPKPHTPFEPQILHPKPQTLNPKAYTPNPTPQILNLKPQPQNFKPKSQIPNPKPQTPNPALQTLHLKLYTPNVIPQTLNLKPQTLNLEP